MMKRILAFFLTILLCSTFAAGAWSEAAATPAPNEATVEAAATSVPNETTPEATAAPYTFSVWMEEVRENLNSFQWSDWANTFIKDVKAAKWYVWVVLVLLLAAVACFIASKGRKGMIVLGALALVAAFLIAFYRVWEVSQDILSAPLYSWLIAGALILLIIVLNISVKTVKWDSYSISRAAMYIAIAFVLSLFRLWRMPNGGSINVVSLLPLILFSLAYGPIQGAVAGCVYGLLSLINDPWVIHPVQMLLDYPLAFAALGLGGFAAYMPLPERFKLPVAVLLGMTGRFLMAVLSGVVFFADSAPAGQPVLLYSLIYNITYIGPNTLLCLIVSFIPGIDRLLPKKTAA